MLDLLRRALPLLPLSTAQQFGRLTITVILSRWMAPEHFGAFATLYVLVEVLIQPASLGFGQSVVRFGARYFKASQHGLLKGLRRFSLLSVATVGMVVTLLLLYGVVPFIEGSATHFGLFHLLVAVPFGALVQVQAGYLLATQRPRASMFSKQVLPECCTLAAAGFLIMYFGPLDVHEAVWAVALGFMATFFLQTKSMGFRTSAQFAVPEYRGRVWLRRSLPLMLTASGSALITRFDVMLVRVLEDEHAVALFFPVVVIAGLTLIPTNAVTTVIKPELAGLPENARAPAFLALVSQATRALLLSNTLFIILLALAGPVLLALYGERHPEEVLTVLYIMLGGRLLSPFRIIANSLLKLVGNPWYSAVSFAAASIVAVVMAIALHADYGLAGLAMGFTIGFATGVVLRIICVTTTLHIPLAVLLGLSSGAMRGSGR